MPQRIEVPGVGIVEFPDGMSDSEIVSAIEKSGRPKDSRLPAQRFMQDMIGGAIRGAGSIGATLLAPVGDLREQVTGKKEKTLSGLITGDKPNSYQQRVQDMGDALSSMGFDTKSLPYGIGKVGLEVLGTSGVGPGLAAVTKAAGAPAAITAALESAGMVTGANPASVAQKAGDMALRIGSGSVVGGASAGLIDPSSLVTGAALGGAAAPAIKVLGAAGNAVGKSLSGPDVPPEVMAAAKKAIEAGYVIPPTQVKPSLANRVLEGFSGKITTAQNASARNADVSKKLAQQAIGSADLSAPSLQKVRDGANKAYDALAAVGQFAPDSAFRAGLASIKPNTLPGVRNADVADLVTSLESLSSLDAQQTINTLKQLRFDGFANKVAQDPAKKALGVAQLKVAGELESLIDRNLSATGQTDLLTNFRDARKLLAKVHTVEKAVTGSGGIDASVMARELKKGRPLDGELRTIAEFSQSFPKAAQTLERMGSLPQTSPVDWAALGTMSALTQNPLMMAGVAARPIARYSVLSPYVQNRLLQPRNALLSDQGMTLLARPLPAIAADR